MHVQNISYYRDYAKYNGKYNNTDSRQTQKKDFDNRHPSADVIFNVHVYISVQKSFLCYQLHIVVRGLNVRRTIYLTYLLCYFG